MNFSSILDISSFFIGMIINLLLIALICYYFKRKYENLEIAQNEQAKVLYQLLQNSGPKVKSLNDILNNDKEVKEVKEVKQVKEVIESDSDTDSDTDSDSDSDDDIVPPKIIESNLEIKTINLDQSEKVENNKIQELKIDLNTMDLNTMDLNTIVNTMDLNTMDLKLTDLELKTEFDIVDKDITDSELETDYSKMTIKQLKEILSVKGINANKLKKNEMIELIEKSSISINE